MNKQEYYLMKPYIFAVALLSPFLFVLGVIVLIVIFVLGWAFLLGLFLEWLYKWCVNDKKNQKQISS